MHSHRRLLFRGQLLQRIERLQRVFSTLVNWVGVDSLAMGSNQEKIADWSVNCKSYLVKHVKNPLTGLRVT